MSDDPKLVIAEGWKARALAAEAREERLIEATRELANEAAKAVSTPNAFAANTKHEQQALSQAAARARLAALSEGPCSTCDDPDCSGPKGTR